MSAKVHPSAHLFATGSVRANAGGSLEGASSVSCGRRVAGVLRSLQFSFVALVTTSLVLSSVLSWSFTEKAAQHSIDLVSNDYATVVVTQIASEFDRRLAAAEHVAEMNAAYFRIGLLNVDNRTMMYQTFFKEISTLVTDTISSMSMTTKEGGLNGLGYIFPITTTGYMVRWDTIGGNMTETAIDPTTGALLGVDFVEVDSDSTNSAWYTCANTSIVGSYGWTVPYFWYSNIYLSTSRTLLDVNDQLLGVMTADMQLGFVDTLAKTLAANSSVGTEFVILDSSSGWILGTSLADFSLTNDDDPDNPTGVYLEDGTELLQALRQFILDETGRSSSSSTLYSDLPTFSGYVSVSGETLLVSVSPFDRVIDVNPSHSIHWVLIHVLDRSSIESQIRASNQHVIIAVVCICVSCIIATTVLLAYAMRLMRHLSVVLTSFARFEFRAHVEGGDLKSKSFFTELREMQTAVLEVTRAFKRHLDTRQGLFANGRAGGGDSKSHYVAGSPLGHGPHTAGQQPSPPPMSRIIGAPSHSPLMATRQTPDQTPPSHSPPMPTRHMAEPTGRDDSTTTAPITLTPSPLLQPVHADRPDRRLLAQTHPPASGSGGSFTLPPTHDRDRERARANSIGRHNINV